MVGSVCFKRFVLSEVLKQGTAWIHLAEMTVIFVHSEDVRMDKLFPCKVGFWKFRRSSCNLQFKICPRSVGELPRHESSPSFAACSPWCCHKGHQILADSSPRLVTAPPLASTQLHPLDSLMPLFIFSSFPIMQKFYQGAANRGLINAVFWKSVGGFLITNAVRLLHWCPGWKIKIWQRA